MTALESPRRRGPFDPRTLRSPGRPRLTLVPALPWDESDSPPGGDAIGRLQLVGTPVWTADDLEPDGAEEQAIAAALAHPPR